MLTPSVSPASHKVFTREEGHVLTGVDSGNRLYQTLGNVQVNPAMGITIPDLETSDALYVSPPSPPPRAGTNTPSYPAPPRSTSAPPRPPSSTTPPSP